MIIYVRRDGGKPLPKLVKGRALVDLPAHGAKAGEFVS